MMQFDRGCARCFSFASGLLFNTFPTIATGMKKFIAGLIALTLLGALIVWLLTFLTPREKPVKFYVGTPLSPGKVAPQLVSTWDTGVLLAPDGSLWCWGGSLYALNGIATVQGSYVRPHRIGKDSDWQKVSSSWLFIVAIKTNGTLWGWGNNGQGQLAQPAGQSFIKTPTQIGVETNWADISVGAGQSLALKRDGSIWGWGQNGNGQLGIGTTTDTFTPTRIGSEKNWRSIAAGAFNGYALKTDGTIWRWGLDTISGGTTNDLTPVQIDPSTNWIKISSSDFVIMALKSDGTLWVGGQNASLAAGHYVKNSVANLIQIGTDTDWQDVSAGQSHFFARKRDGSWWVCGQNGQGLGKNLFGLGDYEQLTRVPYDFEPWAFANGDQNSLLLTMDGNLWSWGERLGAAPQPGMVKSVLNRLIGLLPGTVRRRLLFNQPPKVMDSQPFLVWRLPDEMRKFLGTNSTQALVKTNN
jgi:alpha-tubulin suppressor-like RCC1 family protein